MILWYIIDTERQQMIDKRKLQLFKELYDRSETIFIMCPNDALKDQMLSAASLYAVISANSQKNIKLFFPNQSQVERNDIFYAWEAKTQLGHENLCISLDYDENAVDQVSYHVDEGVKKFFLTIKPKSGAQPLSEDGVEFSYTGATADMIVLVGVDDLTSLSRLYVGYEQLFNSTALVSINSYETQFGNLKFDIIGTSSFSEFVAQMLVDFDLPIDPDSATNLLAGIKQETKNFESYTTTADTFEMVSKLMRAGARRMPTKTDSADEPQPQFSGSSTSKEAGGIKISDKFTITNSESLIVQQNDEDLYQGEVVDEYDLSSSDKDLYEQSLLESENEAEKSPQRRQKKHKKKKKKFQKSPKPVAHPPKTSPSPLEERAMKKGKSRLKRNKKKSPKPGDLDYNPSGFGPTGG